MGVTYHNTTGATGDHLRAYREAAAGQEADVLAFFAAHPGRSFTPEPVQRRVMPRAPLTSARRAITNLTAKGLLVKTGETATGKFGRPVRLWMLAPEPMPQRELPL
jgi:hypothetical protein